MPAIPSTLETLTLASILARDVDDYASRTLQTASILARDVDDYASRTLHTAGNLLMRRNADNHVGEVIGVIIGIAVICGAIFYWGIHKEGSCEFRTPKKR